MTPEKVIEYRAVRIVHCIYDAVGPKINMSLSQFRHETVPLIDKELTEYGEQVAQFWKAFADESAKQKVLHATDKHPSVYRHGSRLIAGGGGGTTNVPIEGCDCADCMATRQKTP